MSGSSSIISGIQALAASLLIVFACPLLAQECDPAGASISPAEKAAFSKLKGCEYDKDAHPASLLWLAFMYQLHGEFTSPEKRMEKMYSLVVKSALMGEPGAITTLANIYESDVPLLSMKAQPRKEKCLLDIEDNSEPPFVLEAVRECLNIQE